MGKEASGGLFCELYWGDNVSEVWSFGPERERVRAGLEGTAELPLYGFTLPESPFLLAERHERGYRVYVPAGVRVERKEGREGFLPVPEDGLQRHEGRAWVELSGDVTVRLCQGELSLWLQPSVAGKPLEGARLKDYAWVAMLVLLSLTLPLAFLGMGPDPVRAAESNARVLEAARAKEAAERQRLGVDTPARPLSEDELQQRDGGMTPLPANLSVH